MGTSKQNASMIASLLLTACLASSTLAESFAPPFNAFLQGSVLFKGAVENDCVDYQSSMNVTFTGGRLFTTVDSDSDGYIGTFAASVSESTAWCGSIPYYPNAGVSDFCFTTTGHIVGALVAPIGEGQISCGFDYEPAKPIAPAPSTVNTDFVSGSCAFEGATAYYNVGQQFVVFGFGASPYSISAPLTSSGSFIGEVPSADGKNRAVLAGIVTANSYVVGSLVSEGAGNYTLPACNFVFAPHDESAVLNAEKMAVHADRSGAAVASMLL